MDMTVPGWWEHDLGQERAREVCAELVLGLEHCGWTVADVRLQLAVEERRLTRAQAAALWMGVIADARLAALCEGAPV